MFCINYKSFKNIIIYNINKKKQTKTKKLLWGYVKFFRAMTFSGYVKTYAIFFIKEYRFSYYMLHFYIVVHIFHSKKLENNPVYLQYCRAKIELP